MGQELTLDMWGFVQPGVVDGVPAQAAGLDQMIFKVLSNVNHSVILWPLRVQMHFSSPSSVGLG